MFGTNTGLSSMCTFHSVIQLFVRGVDGSHDLSSIARFVIAFYRYILENDTSLVPETDLNSFQSVFLIINTAALLALISGKPLHFPLPPCSLGPTNSRRLRRHLEGENSLRGCKGAVGI